MLKILLKRQLYELNRSFFYDPKKGKSRSKFASAAFIVLYALLMVCVLGGMFAFCAYQLANPLRAAGLDWLYFALFGIIGLMFGVFGSVFNTYAALYKANDNDLLLSLPVPVGSILLSRLLGVYLMGLMFSAVVFVPAAIVYLCIDFSVGTLLGCILGMLSISVFVFVLSCALGWVVAKIASKLKRKSFLTVIISLVFIGGYYYVVNNITTLLMQFTQYAGAIGAGVKNFAYPVYLFGRMSAGNLVSAPLPVFGTAALALLTFYVMSKSFLKLATASSDTVTAKYNRNARQKASGVFSALLKRELGRFTASPAYMLNCGFGVIIMPIAGILLLIRGAALRSMLFELFDSSTGTIAILAAAAVCLVSTMNDMTAPSVSLEGKTLWILRSMPVTTQQIFRAKLDPPCSFFCPQAVSKVCYSLCSRQHPFTLLFYSFCFRFVFADFSAFVHFRIGSLLFNRTELPDSTAFRTAKEFRAHSKASLLPALSQADAHFLRILLRAAAQPHR